VLRDQFDLPSGGMVVETVVNDSLAEKLGLARHDVLLEIAGKPVGGSPDVRAALEGVKAGDKVTAVVLRKGQRKTLEAVR
jgi:S1-C subfamily serine protease